ncbi:MAG TPA: hypothetical protein VF533_16350 [Solirubrobacteraceae bacterium]|jgi:ribosomal protein L37E
MSAPRCPRCGLNYGYDAELDVCAGCWPGRATAQEVRRLAERRSVAAQRVLGAIADPAAAPRCAS